MDYFLTFIKKNKFEIVFAICLILTAAFFRLYRIDEYMTFLGDEGRDALIVGKMLLNFDFPLLGAPTSVGNMYNGPLYYYMMASAMAVWWMNPVAAAIMVALIGTATVALVYYLARVWFGKVAAIISATLYALSPVNIVYSRSSWNPNPAPFFALLGIIGLYKSYRTKNYLWLIITGGALAFAVQMHLLALILIPVYGLIWLFALKEKIKDKADLRNFWLGLGLAFLTFIFLMSPMAIFDYKYNQQNFNAFTTFFFGDRASTVNLNPFNTLERIVPIYSENLINRYMAGGNYWLMLLVSLLVLLPIIIFLVNLIKKRRFSWPYFTLSIWFIGGIMGLALYKQTIYDHYSSFLNPAIFLLFGSIVNLINSIDSKRVNQYVRGAFFLLFLVLVIVNLQLSPSLSPPNRQLQRTQEVAKFIISQTGDKPFNFALIAERNYDAAYQFFLDQYGHKPGQLPFEKTEQLFVVCEDKICEPVGHSKFEISAFGWSKIEWQKESSGVKVFKLVHNPEAEAAAAAAEAAK
ncbi:MAG TPA: glycosyltransferase family 39 protein [Patescibacteria group bacterium]|nr:glycosyltransferase family 39 protein [Patescibacteria group bacterium]